MTYVGLVPFRMGHTALGTGPGCPISGVRRDQRAAVLRRRGRAARGPVPLAGDRPAGGGSADPHRHGGALHLGQDADPAEQGGDQLPQRATLAAPRTAQPGGGEHRRPGRAHPAGDLADRAVGAHTRKLGRTWWVPNEHAPWVLRSAQLVEFDDDLVAAAGVPVAGPGCASCSPRYPNPFRPAQPRRAVGWRPWRWRSGSEQHERCWRRPARAVRGRAGRRRRPAGACPIGHLADPITGRCYVANSGVPTVGGIPCIPGQHLGTCLSILQNQSPRVAARRRAPLALTGYSSKIATALVQPADAAWILTGKQDTSKPLGGNDSRLCNFSMWE